jgi:hypothetical protein
MSRTGSNNPNYKDGRRKTRIYRIWITMIQRCHNQNNWQFKNYGARGISVCDEWRESFIRFREWAFANGYAPDLEIDRQENDGPYAAWNCRWATKKQNCRNTRRNVIVHAFGEQKTVADWSEDHRCIVNHITLRSRLSRGTPPETAITSKRIIANQFTRRCA